MTWPPPSTTIAVAVLVLAATYYDLRSRRIPNTLTLGAAAVALAMHAAVGGWSGLLLAASGWAVGAALFFPLFALGGMGAGDVKLLAAIGAWLGPAGAIWTGLYGAVAGGVMALIVALSRGYASTAMKNLGNLLRVWSIAGVQPVERLTLQNTASPKLPYALPLAAGALVTMWLAR
jgi:prepilin peptidase CpaA